MYTLQNIAEKHSISINKAKAILADFGITILSDKIALTQQKHTTYDHIISVSLASEKDKYQTDKRQKDKRQQELLSRDYIIFTAMGLCKPEAAKILQQCIEININKSKRSRIVVCAEVIKQIKALAEKDPRFREIADTLYALQRHQILTLLQGTLAEENRVISIFIKKRALHESILVIGFNRSLSSFINARNSKYKDTQDYTLIFERDITKKGFLTSPIKQASAFCDASAKQKAPYSEHPLPLRGSIPAEGDIVYYKTKTGYAPVTLGKTLGQGGEANVYELEKEKCAKILKHTSNSVLKMKKIQIMCSKYTLMCSIDHAIMQHIAWPEYLLYNAVGEPIGYVMKQFKGATPFSHFSHNNFPTYIPALNKQSQVTMAINFTQIIDFLHYNNVILCDINRGNILFDSIGQAYLVDLDSAQIADANYYYPSSVGFPEYRSPEHIYDTNFSFKRKKADDVWILQTLLFQILTPIGNPYAGAIAVKDDREIIKQGLYPYQAGSNQAQAGIKGSPWHMIVSHFPKFLKELFWNSFSGTGKFFTEENRRSAKVWLNVLVHYQDALPEMIKEDAASGDYKPTSYRKYITKESNQITPQQNLDALLQKLDNMPTHAWNSLT